MVRTTRDVHAKKIFREHLHAQFRISSHILVQLLHMWIMTDNNKRTDKIGSKYQTGIRMFLRVAVELLMVVFYSVWDVSA